MLSDKQRVHLIGIGGIGVSGVARLLHQRGFVVSGSDVRESQLTLGLRELGVTVHIGHSPSHLDGVELVIYSTAIPDSNPEKIAAKERGIPLVHRAEVLGELINPLEAIGVLGTHGKGTVSGMLTVILEEAGLEPSFYIGALLNNYGINARFTGGQAFVAEVDESDGSLVYLHPRYAVLNNLEADHLNYYKDFEAIVAALEAFVRDNPQTRFVINADCPGCRRLFPTLEGRERGHVSFGFQHDAEYRGEALETNKMSSSFRVARRGEALGTIELPLPGRYNAFNALAATALGLDMGLGFDVVSRALAGYRGLENRFTLVEAGGVSIVKDYNSHPTGIRRVLEAASDFASKRVIAVFKPYRFTLMHYLQNEYAVAFKGADLTLLTEMYTAGEVPIAGVDEGWMLEMIRAQGCRADFVGTMENLRQRLLDELEPGDMLIFFGGDDFFRFADALAQTLEARSC